MTISRLAYRKKQLFRFLLAFSLVLSLFSASGFVGLSSNHPQKTTTEFLWAERQHTFSVSTDYSCKQASASLSGSSLCIRVMEYGALLRYNQVFLAKFNQLTHQFKTIKPEIMAICGFPRFIIHEDELVIV